MQGGHASCFRDFDCMAICLTDHTTAIPFRLQADPSSHLRDSSTATHVIGQLRTIGQTPHGSEPADRLYTSLPSRPSPAAPEHLCSAGLPKHVTPMHHQLSTLLQPPMPVTAPTAHSLAHVTQTPSTCQVAPELLASCSPMFLPNLGVYFITASLGNHASSM